MVVHAVSDWGQWSPDWTTSRDKARIDVSLGIGSLEDIFRGGHSNLRASRDSASRGEGKSWECLDRKGGIVRRASCDEGGSQSKHLIRREWHLLWLWERQLFQRGTNVGAVTGFDG